MVVLFLTEYKPINTYFPYFDDTRDQVRSSRMEDQKRWELELQKLQKLFKNAAKAAHAKGLLSEETLKSLTMSGENNLDTSGYLSETKTEA